MVEVLMTKEIKLKVDYLEDGYIVLTNSNGDTFSSKSEELEDFLFSANNILF